MSRSSAKRVNYAEPDEDDFAVDMDDEDGGTARKGRRRASRNVKKYTEAENDDNLDMFYDDEPPKDTSELSLFNFTPGPEEDDLDGEDEIDLAKPWPSPSIPLEALVYTNSNLDALPNLSLSDRRKRAIQRMVRLQRMKLLRVATRLPASQRRFIKQRERFIVDIARESVAAKQFESKQRADRMVHDAFATAGATGKLAAPVVPTEDSDFVFSSRNRRRDGGGMMSDYGGPVSRGGTQAAPPSDQPCAFSGGCDNPRLPVTSFCYAHILSDPRQQLFTQCTYVAPSGARCWYPIIKNLSSPYCANHTDAMSTRHPSSASGGSATPSAKRAKSAAGGSVAGSPATPVAGGAPGSAPSRKRKAPTPSKYEDGDDGEDEDEEVDDEDDYAKVPKAKRAKKAGNTPSKKTGKPSKVKAGAAGTDEPGAGTASPTTVRFVVGPPTPQMSARGFPPGV